MHRGLAKDIEGLWEPWMLLVDELLEDEQLLDTVVAIALSTRLLGPGRIQPTGVAYQ